MLVGMERVVAGVELGRLPLLLARRDLGDLTVAKLSSMVFPFVPLGRSKEYIVKSPSPVSLAFHVGYL